MEEDKAKRLLDLRKLWKPKRWPRRQRRKPLLARRSSGNENSRWIRDWTKEFNTGASLSRQSGESKAPPANFMYRCRLIDIKSYNCISSWCYCLFTKHFFWNLHMNCCVLLRNLFLFNGEIFFSIAGESHFSISFTLIQNGPNLFIILHVIFDIFETDGDNHSTHILTKKNWIWMSRT